MSAAFLSACGSSFPYAPAYPGDDPHFSAPKQAMAPGVEPAQDLPPPRLLMPGDVVTVQVMSADTTEYEELVVDGAGQIHLPLIGDVEVGGLSLSEAEKAVKEVMKRFDRLAEVTVIMVRPEGHVVTVLGALPDRGRLALPPGARVADVIALAGGPLTTEMDSGIVVEVADLASARVYREGKPLPINVAEAVEGHPAHNVYVHPGDHIYVPPQRGHTISILGEVTDAQVLTYHPGMRLTQALALAGDVGEDANWDDVRVVRGPLAAPRIYEASLDAIMEGDSHDVELAAGDIVFVGRHWKGDVTEVLNRLSPIISLSTTFLFLYLSFARLNEESSR